MGRAAGDVGVDSQSTGLTMPRDRLEYGHADLDEGGPIALCRLVDSTSADGSDNAGIWPSPQPSARRVYKPGGQLIAGALVDGAPLPSWGALPDASAD